MKKKVTIFLTIASLFFLVGCKSKESKEEIKETEADSALMYTFTIDEHEYRFRLLDGWIKFPNKDGNIAFLVGNKDIKSFMSAGVEPVSQSLELYKDDFLKKLSESDAQVNLEPEKRQLNGMDSYYLSFVMKDGKNRPLTYNTYLIETEGYFVNLAAWTSEEKPTEETIKNLDNMLDNFEQLK